MDQLPSASGAHAQHQVAQARNRTFTSGAGWSACRYAQSIIKAADDSAPMASASSGHSFRPQRHARHARLRVCGRTDATGKTGLVHELDRHVLQQMAELGLTMQSWNSRPESPRHRCLAIAGTR